MSNRRIINDIEFHPFNNGEFCKYFHKRILKSLDEFKCLDTFHSVERNQFGYIKDKIGILYSSNDVYLSCELIFDDEDETIGDITYMLHFDVKTKSFSHCNFEFVIHNEELSEEIERSLLEADYLFVLNKFTQKIKADKQLPKLISELMFDASEEFQTQKLLQLWTI